MNQAKKRKHRREGESGGDRGGTELPSLGSGLEKDAFELSELIVSPFRGGGPPEATEGGGELGGGGKPGGDGALIASAGEAITVSDMDREVVGKGATVRGPYVIVGRVGGDADNRGEERVVT